MNCRNSFSLIAVFLFLTNPLLAQRLPTGHFNTNRPRQYDLIHYSAALSFDFDQGMVKGVATLRLSPLRRIQQLSLDAIALQVQAVQVAQQDVRFESSGRTLNITLPDQASPTDTFEVIVRYSAHPKAGLYFIRDSDSPKNYFVTTYGENGLHANWTPIFSDVNDRFSTELLLTVPTPYVAIANGKLVEQIDGDNNMRTFHWRQELPHAGYLMALYIGDFEHGTLPSAFGEIPMSYWVPRGKQAQGAYVFRNTTRMVEFFSHRFKVRFPWDKYDQIAIPNFPAGAMEHTGITGHEVSILRTAKDAYDFSPTLDNVATPWSAEAIISHELAHQWFGNLVTCRNLSYIWLNESFASFLMFLWDEESLGEEQYLFSLDLAKQAYYSYVQSENIIRPLEYHYFDDANTIYATEITYFKGAAILHMLRRTLGDDAFFSAMSAYLKKHAFGNVISEDLKIAIEESTGENLDWFFADWITGGGHPDFNVSYDYLGASKQVILHVEQTQPFVEGQNLFQLPVQVTLATQNNTWSEEIWLEAEEEHVALDCPEQPLMVSFDGRGDLVAQITFDKTLSELAYQARHDQLPGRLWAVRELAAHFPAAATTHAVFAEILQAKMFWGLRAEVARQLANVRGPGATNLLESALRAQDYRVRKAAVLALEQFPIALSSPKLKQIIRRDQQADVVAAAILALSKIEDGLSPDFLRSQLDRKSWYDEIQIAGMLACEQLADESLLPVIREYAAERYNQDLRGAALNAWAATAPEDEALRDLLIGLTKSSTYVLQQAAIAMLGDLYVEKAAPRLREIIADEADDNLVTLAEKALRKLDITE